MQKPSTYIFLKKWAIVSICIGLVLMLFQSFPAIVQAKQPVSIKDRLEKDIHNFTLDDFTHIEAAFILSGVQDSDSLDYYIAWYETLRDDIQNIILDPADWVASASRVFNYLHGTWLKTYQLEATTLLDVVNRQVYNCVSATILFNLICDDMGWRTDAFETPTHVLTLFNNFTQRLLVENTSSMGFNIVKNLKSYSKHLTHFYPENEAYRIGLDRLYLHEYQNAREIDNTELLGLLAYNQAYFSRKKGDYTNAYDYVLLAQYFNRDSRSNERFERNLYNEWGKKLFDNKDFSQAFTVFADATYRYPEEAHFSQNTKAAYFRCLSQTWSDKNWRKTRQLTDEILELEILDSENNKQLVPRFNHWIRYLKQIGREDYVREAEGFLEILK